MLTIAVCDDDFYFANKFEKTLHILMGDKVSRIDVFINPEKLLKSDIVYDYIYSVCVWNLKIQHLFCIFTCRTYQVFTLIKLMI